MAITNAAIPRLRTRLEELTALTFDSWSDEFESHVNAWFDRRYIGAIATRHNRGQGNNATMSLRPISCAKLLAV